MRNLAVSQGPPDGLQLFVDEDMTESFTRPCASGTAAVFSARCPDSDGPNEDGAALAALTDERGVVALADGVGGQPAGDQAASLALGELLESCAAATQGETLLRDAILDGFERANHAVIGHGTGAATTLIAAEIDGATVRTYHTGDSMILVVGQRGRIKMQTVSHSPVGYAVESGLLDEKEAMHHEDRHIVSNMIGDPGMRIEMGSTLRLAAHDTLLLASDGLFDNLHVDEIVERVRSGPLDEACTRVAALARQRMTNPMTGVPSKPDDLTFVLFRRR